MQDRRVLRRQADRQLVQLVQELKLQANRRLPAVSEELEHNRRRTIRHNCNVSIEMVLRYKSGKSDTWNMETLSVKGRILDLSNGGTSLFMTQQIELGQELRLVIAYQEREKIKAVGKVRWLKHVPAKGGYVLGVQFDSVAPEDQGKLKSVLKELDETVGL